LSSLKLREADREFAARAHLPDQPEFRRYELDIFGADCVPVTCGARKWR
jgi:hypothetical protein